MRTKIAPRNRIGSMAVRYAESIMGFRRGETAADQRANQAARHLAQFGDRVWKFAMSEARRAQVRASGRRRHPRRRVAHAHRRGRGVSPASAW